MLDSLPLLAYVCVFTVCVSAYTTDARCGCGTATPPHSAAACNRHADASHPAARLPTQAACGYGFKLCPVWAAWKQDADPERPVMIYCTGGIRCDVYGTYLRKKG